MSVTIKFRRGTASEWVANGSTVLASGEPGYEIDSGRFKIGNGIVAWSGLPYASVIPSGFIAGSGINVGLGTNGSTATISVSGLNSSYISDFNEAVDDRIGSGLFVAGTGINLSYNDGSNSFTVSVTGLVSNPANNRVLTSRDSSTTGIDAESNLTFDGSLLTINGDMVANTGTLDVLAFDTNITPNLLQGQIGWDNTEGTIDIGLTNTAAISIGEHNVIRVRNETGGPLYKGQAVYANGVHSNGIITPSLYVADGSIAEIRFMGLLLENINNNNNGYVINFGHIFNIDTRGNVASNIAVGDETWADGDILYAHPTVAGKLTKVEPKNSINVAIILDAANNGKIFVKSNSYGDLNQLHDVAVSGATNGQFLQYNSVTDYWVASSSGNFTTLLVNGTGVSVSGHTHTASNITDFTEAVQDVVGASGFLVGVSGISISYNDAGNTLTIASSGGGGSTISNAADNRILTSDGTSTGINAESNLTFNGTTLAVTGIIDIDNLRLDANTISSTNTNGNIVLAPNGTGDVQVDADTLRVGDSNSAATVTTNGTGNLTLSTNNGTNSGQIVIQQGANNDIILQPNGVGQLQGRSTGNPRGANATDWQRNASTNSQVAAGDNSTISGGSNNTASSIYSVVGGGDNNSATGAGSTIAGGASNVTNGNYATVCGGYANNYTYGTSSYTFIGGGISNSCENSNGVIGGGDTNRITGPGGGTHSIIGGGYSNLINSNAAYNSIVGGSSNQIAGGNSSTICGGYINVIQSGVNCSILGGHLNTIESTTNNSSILNGLANLISTTADNAIAGGKNANALLYGEQTYAAGAFFTFGDAQTRRFILRGRDTTVGTIHLKLDGDLSSSRHLYIPDWTSWYYTIKVIARRNSPIGSTSASPNSDTGSYRFEGAIENKNNDGSSCVLLGNTKTVIYEDNAAWDCNISILWDGNNKAYLDIECTYDYTTDDVYWVANVEVVQVSVPIEGPADILLACGFGSFIDAPFYNNGYYNDREYYRLDDSGTYYYLFWDGTNWVISTSLGGTSLYSSPTYVPIANDWIVGTGMSPGGDTYDYSVTSTCPSAPPSSSPSSSGGSGSGSSGSGSSGSSGSGSSSSP